MTASALKERLLEQVFVKLNNDLQIVQAAKSARVTFCWQDRLKTTKRGRAVGVSQTHTIVGRSRKSASILVRGCTKGGGLRI